MTKKEIKHYNKVVNGFVSQHFVKDGDKYVCEYQDFISGDDVSRESLYSSNIEHKLIPGKEEYQQFNMVQPGYDYYYLFVWGCVSSEIIGPFNTEDEREDSREKMKQEEGEDKHIYIPFKITKGAEIELY